jgi:plastocyanin
MKKFTLICLGSLIMSQLHATVITVFVTNNQFTPANFNCVVGDTVRYNCTEGFHNVSTLVTASQSGVVPVGAPNIFSGIPLNVTWGYDYVVLVPGDYRYYCQVHSFEGINGHVGRFTATTPLPAEMKNLDARFENKAVTVSWQTLTEQNVNYFSVRRSFNGADFSELGRVKAAGNSTALQSYRFTDDKTGNAGGYIYYSLATVDQDGKQSLSSIVRVKNKGIVKKIITSLSPNPVSKQGRLAVQFNADGAGRLYATVYNAAGKKVAANNLNSVTGLNNGHLDVGMLPPGIYNIVFTLGSQRETHRVVLQ